MVVVIYCYLYIKMKKIEKTIFSEKYIRLIANIVELRHKKGISQKKLSDLLAVPPSYIGRIEICERRLDVLELMAILKALDVPPKNICSLLMTLM